MRSDAGLPQAFRDSAMWTKDPFSGASAPHLERLSHYAAQEYHRHAYSGSERNTLFLNLAGGSFADISGVSGIDSLADSRSWCALDYNRDGWSDIAIVHANAPLLDLFENRLGERIGAHFVAVRLEGGNDKPSASARLANRDAVGAVIVASVGGRELRRTHRCGEGFAAQNSRTLLIGLGDASKADAIEVRWPSESDGSRAKEVPAGSLVRFREGAEPEITSYSP